MYCGSPGVQVSLVLPLPGLRFNLVWLSRGSGFICFDIPCGVSPTLALPGLRFHLFWLSPGLMFHVFWLSQILACK